MTTSERLAQAGLAVPEAELHKLIEAVEGMDRLATTLHGPRPYADEPLSAFRLKRA